VHATCTKLQRKPSNVYFRYLPTAPISAPKTTMDSSTSPLELMPIRQGHAPAPVLDPHESGNVYDEQDMAAMQEKQVFFRRLEWAAVVALNSTVVLPWQTVLVGLGFVLYNGGTGGLFFSFILAAAGFVPTYLSIAELSSSFVKDRIGAEIGTFD
jgi:hypothetical protein